MSLEDMAASAQDPKNLTVEFEFDSTLVRTIAKEGQAWFVAKDVCDILDIGDASKAVSRIDDDERGTTTVRTPGGPQEVLTVNESGLYSLIFTSRKAEAKRIKSFYRSEQPRHGDRLAWARRTNDALCICPATCGRDAL